MRFAATSVQQFVAGETEASYLGNLLLRSAVERQFEILAEAFNRLLNLSPQLVQRISDYRNIINFRNFLSHVYDEVDNGVVWDAVQKDVPTLLRQVETLLAALGDE